MIDFSKLVTAQTVSAICPGVRADILESLLTDTAENFTNAGIDTEIKLAHFFGQIATETIGLGRLDENLYYTTPKRLQIVYGTGLFPTLAVAKQYIKDPEKLANYVYANKNGNGNTASGDGYTYRGSGLIQLTGRENFRNAGELLDMPLEDEPDLVRLSDSALAIALAYWIKRDISSVADEETDAAVEKVTKKINPALHGLADRKTYFKKALKVFRQQMKSLDLVAALAAGPAVEAALGTELSGPQWVLRFPTSRSIDDLVEPFAAGVAAFVEAMRDAAANVSISATYRPKERAYLMHWSWRIARDGFDPALVPPMAGVDIDWVHPTLAKSKKAARDMVTAYGIVSKPALNSRHTERRAIDMTISWSGNLAIKRSNGALRTITSQPRDGGNSELWQVGSEYGAIKLTSDPPHWSDDGR